MMIKMVLLAYRPADSVAFFSIKMCNILHILLILLKLLTRPFFNFIYSGYCFSRICSVIDDSFKAVKNQMRKIRAFNKSLKDGKKPIVNKPSDTALVERRSGREDRREIHTFIANDRRSGIVDRRQKDKIRP